jgi:hypothetical protein
MKYFHRTHLPPESVLGYAAEFFGGRLAPLDESPRRRGFAGAIGHVTVTVEAEGGHYTRITVETNQVGESEADRLAKRFLTLVHTRAHVGHEPRGAY